MFLNLQSFFEKGLLFFCKILKDKLNGGLALPE